jgi:hypothetical protein
LPNGAPPVKTKIPFDVWSEPSARASGVWMKKPLGPPLPNAMAVTMLSVVRMRWPARGERSPLPWISQISFDPITLTASVQVAVWGERSLFEAVISTV